MNKKKKYLTDSIFIIQSLREADGDTGKELSESLAKQNSDKVTVYYSDPHYENEFFDCLDKIENNMGKKWTYPIIHIEAHGSTEGIELRMGDFVEWTKFQDQLSRINKKSSFNLLLSFGSCFGFHFHTVLTTNKYSPLAVLLGPSGEICNTYLVERYKSFYSTLINGGDAYKALYHVNTSAHVRKGKLEILSAETLFDLAWEYSGEVMNDANSRTEHLDNLRLKLLNQGVRDVTEEMALRAWQVQRNDSYKKIRARFLGH